MKKILLSMLAVASAINVNAQATNSDISGNDLTVSGEGYLYSFNQDPARTLSHATLNCTDGGNVYDTYSSGVGTWGVDTVIPTGNGVLTYTFGASVPTSNARQAANRLTTGNCVIAAKGTNSADLSTNSTVTARMKSSAGVRISILASSDDAGWITHDADFQTDTLLAGADWKEVTFALNDTAWNGKGDLASTIGWELWFAKNQTIAAGVIQIDWIAFGDATDPNVSSNEVVVTALNVYPNPATDQLNVVFDATSASTVELTDLTGKVVSSQSANAGANTISFNVANVNAGVYFVNIKNAAGNSAQKVIIK